MGSIATDGTGSYIGTAELLRDGSVVQSLKMCEASVIWNSSKSRNEEGSNSATVTSQLVETDGASHTYQVRIVGGGTGYAAGYYRLQSSVITVISLKR